MKEYFQSRDINNELIKIKNDEELNSYIYYEATDSTDYIRIRGNESDLTRGLSLIIKKLNQDTKLSKAVKNVLILFLREGNKDE